MNGGPSDNPISDNNVSTTNELSDGYEGASPLMGQPCWDLKEEAEEEVESVADLPEIFGLPVGIPVGGDDGRGGGHGGDHSEFHRGRPFRARLGAKGMPSMSPLSNMPGKLNCGFDCASFLILSWFNLMIQFKFKVLAVD